MSEYGWQAFPPLDVWGDVTIPEDLQYNSTLMNQRQHHADGTQQLLQQIAVHFTIPGNLNQVGAQPFFNFIYLTQLVQSICIKSETEFYRRGRDGPQNTMGALYWQLNSIWQAPDWSSISYGGEWKMLQNYAKKFFSPVLTSIVEDRTIFKADDMQVFITSDLLESITCSLNVTLWSWNAGSQGGKPLYSVPFEKVVLGPQNGALIYSVSIAQFIAKGNCPSRNDCVVLVDTSCSSASGTSIFVPSNEFYLSSFAQVSLPAATVKIASLESLSPNTIRIGLVSTQMAPFCYISFKSFQATPGYFEDNGFMLVPNQIKYVVFTSWQQSVSTSALGSNIQVTTLSNIY